MIVVGNAVSYENHKYGNVTQIKNFNGETMCEVKGDNFPGKLWFSIGALTDRSK